MPELLASEALFGHFRAHFGQPGAFFYGAYVALRSPATWITHAVIAAFDASHSDPQVLDWYPDAADGR